MSLTRPVLDDRSYEQLRDELVRRIPVYTPEWTDHNVSDPGITLIELFSYLGENLLYRFNQIPDATYMEYLRLLQIPLRPATPARAMAVMSTKEPEGVMVEKGSLAMAGSVPFETLNEARVLPLSAVAMAKLADEPPEEGSDEAEFFRQAYEAAQLSEDTAAPYQTVTLWHDEPGVPLDFSQGVDGMIWLAVLAESADLRDSTLEALAGHPEGPLAINIGFVPDERIDADPGPGSPAFSELFRCPGGANAAGSGPSVQWQISTSRFDNDGHPVYRAVSVVGDTTDGLTREGVVRLRFPRELAAMGPFEVEDPDLNGTGDLPPYLLDDDLEGRLLFWLRAFRLDGSRVGRVMYMGANATEVVQTRTARSEFLGTGNGQPNQQFDLINRQVAPGSLVLEVEDASGWQTWREVSGFHGSHDGHQHYVLDAEAGRVTFGNGLQGHAPQIGRRIRVSSYRYGGGTQGNVAAEAITALQPPRPIKITNPLPARGGADAETLEQAVERIPGELRRRDRAVTEGDFKELALMTPGANIKRAECLPRFHPAVPKAEAAGVVTVIVWPAEDSAHPNAPMPDKTQLRQVCAYLDARRLVTTEHYVIPPAYRPIAVAVGLKVKPGYGVDAVRHWVELVIRQYLAPLPPYGPSGEGWPLGRAVYGPELEAAALQVEGVEFVRQLEVVARDGTVRAGDGGNRVALERYEVPELLAITVEDGPVTVDPAVSDGIRPPAPGKQPVPIPVLREEC